MLLTVASDASCPHPVQPHRMLLTITLLSRGAGHVIDQGLARAWPGSVLLGGLVACRGDTPSGSFVGAVAGAVHEHLRNAKLQLTVVLAPAGEVPALYIHPDHRRRLRRTPVRSDLGAPECV